MFEEAHGQPANLSAFGALSLQCRDIRGPKNLLGMNIKYLAGICKLHMTLGPLK
ncbi:hypothetical protein D3C85_1911260 [compost metagenome]